MKKILVLVLLISLFLNIGCSLPKVVATAATLPAIEVSPGEQTIFRFTVSTSKDVKIERLTLEIMGNVEVRWLSWYDESTGDAISSASYQTSENNKVTLWPLLETIKVPAGTTKIFSVRGEISGQGWVVARLIDLGVKRGEVEGLPSITTYLEVR